MIDRRKLALASQQVAASLDRALPQMLGTTERVGFVVFLFDFGGDGSNLAYISNGTRETMISAVREWLARQEAGLATDPPGPRGDA